jgi:cobalt-zinc-cadmium efflux system outer membrane protein
MNARPRDPGQIAPQLGPAPAPEVVPLPQLTNNSWSVLFEIKDEGPANGLTLEQAMNRLVSATIALRAKSLDIPQADADVLTAGLHANPVVYADGQLVPYKHYSSASNPGGPTEYDLNVAYPLDLSGKRRSRIEVANAAKRVVEALYQDSVRLEIDRLGNAYVDALAARLAVRTTKAGLAHIDEVIARAAQHPKDPRMDSLQHRLRLQRQTTVLALIEAEASWKNGKRILAMILNLPSEDIPLLELRGAIEDRVMAPPPLEELKSSALANRPDLMSYQLGLQRAQADVRLSKANRLPDVYALYQPFTYQDLSPFGFPGSRSWAAGATVTIPLFDRNQGNIRRAGLNVDQTQLELRSLELRVRSDVEGAFDDYQATRRAIQLIERELLPEAEKERGERLQHFREGRLDPADYLSAQRDLDDLGRQYRDLLIRHRRSMLAINTAVGIRVFP